MATPGIDCDLTINGTGYFIKQDSWDRNKPRKYTTRFSKTGTNKYIDKGPLANDFSFTIVLWANVTFRGSVYSNNPSTLRSGLWSLYNTSNSTVTLVTPTNETFTCLFTDLKEHIVTVGDPNISPYEFEMDVKLLQVT